MLLFRIGRHNKNIDFINRFRLSVFWTNTTKEEEKTWTQSINYSVLFEIPEMIRNIFYFWKIAIWHSAFNIYSFHFKGHTISNWCWSKLVVSIIINIEKGRMTKTNFKSIQFACSIEEKWKESSKWFVQIGTFDRKNSQRNWS